MLKKEKRRLLAMCLITTSLFLCACGGGAESETAGGGRTSFTEEELESGHASFQMGEKLAVDADITPKSVWEKEYAVYYLEAISETDNSDEKAFRKAPTLFGHSYKEFGKLLDGLEPGKLKGEDFALDGFDLRDTYQSKGGQEYRMSGGWSGVSKKYGLKSPFNTAWFSLARQDTGQTDVRICAKRIMEFVPDFGDSRAESLPDPEKTAEKIRHFIEEMTGRKVHDGYKFIPVTQDNIDSMKERIAPNLMLNMEGTGECGVYLFWYDVDGLPLHNLMLNYKLGSDEEADVLCRWGSNTSDLNSISEHVQEAAVDGDGLLIIEVSSMRRPGKVCQEKAAVIGPEKVLGQIRDYYDRKLLLDETVVTDIQLAYMGYFANVDGTVYPVFTPVWEVVVRDDASSSRVPRHRFVYDAFTGKCLLERGDVTWL